MLIKSVTLNNFRNYENLDIELDEKINIFYGDNAQGKTNLLEAAYLSGTTKSHRSNKDKEMIRFGENEAHIKTVVIKQNKEYQIDLHLRNNKSKGIAINKIPIKKASELFGILNIVFFSPEDLNIIKDGPSERRRFLDAELCQLDKIYLSDLTNYNRIINQRNKLLKDIYYNPSLKDTLDVWDMQLIDYGKRIIKRRNQFIEELGEIVRIKHEKISGGKEILDLSYEPNVLDIFLGDELLQSREKDLRFGTTHIGPHRDDLSFKISDIDMRNYGSQGQQRSCALSLKLSEIDIVEQTIGEKPVLMLDDVLSELDSNRQNYLLNSITDTQTLISCTGLDEFIKNRFKIDKIFLVEDGNIKIQENNDF